MTGNQQQNIVDYFRFGNYSTILVSISGDKVDWTDLQYDKDHHRYQLGNKLEKVISETPKGGILKYNLKFFFIFLTHFDR